VTCLALVPRLPAKARLPRVGTRDRNGAGLASIVALAIGIASGPAFAGSRKVCPPDTYPNGLGCVHPAKFEPGMYQVVETFVTTKDAIT
jgi:hypothetical protein